MERCWHPLGDPAEPVSARDLAFFEFGRVKRGSGFVLTGFLSRKYRHKDALHRIGSACRHPKATAPICPNINIFANFGALFLA
jgi:hypothetical protein